MTKNIKVLLVILFANIAINASANPVWLRGVEIQKIHVQPAGNIYVSVDKTVPELGCPNTSATHIELDLAAKNVESQYALFLTAFTAGNKLDIYLKRCGSAFPIAENTNILM